MPPETPTKTRAMWPILPRGVTWGWRDAGDGSDQAGRRHRSQTRLASLVKSEEGDPAPRLSHQPARASSMSRLDYLV
jgi:hypothetical protein